MVLSEYGFDWMFYYPYMRHRHVGIKLRVIETKEKLILYHIKTAVSSKFGHCSVLRDYAMP